MKVLKTFGIDSDQATEDISCIKLYTTWWTWWLDMLCVYFTRIVIWVSMIEDSTWTQEPTLKQSQSGRAVPDWAHGGHSELHFEGGVKGIAVGAKGGWGGKRVLNPDGFSLSWAGFSTASPTGAQRQKRLRDLPAVSEFHEKPRPSPSSEDEVHHRPPASEYTLHAPGPGSTATTHFLTRPPDPTANWTYER